MVSQSALESSPGARVGSADKMIPLEHQSAVLLSPTGGTRAGGGGETDTQQPMCTGIRGGKAEGDSTTAPGVDKISTDKLGASTSSEN